MGVIIFLIAIAIIWGLVTGSDLGKMIVFLGIVAILGWLGSLILGFLIYVTYIALLIMLILIGVAVFNLLFK